MNPDNLNPLILSMDTAGHACQVALADGADIISHERKAMARGHGEELVPMVERVLAAVGRGYEDLDRIGVTIGPGSFTGLRVGLAAARGFSATLNIDAVGIGSLAALAATDRMDSPAPQGQAVALDARNSMVYGQLFEPDGEPIGPPEAMADIVFAALVRPGMRLSGTAQPAIAAHLENLSKPITLGRSVPVPSLEAIATLALSADPKVKPSPLYLKEADAAVAKSSGLRASMS